MRPAAALLVLLLPACRQPASVSQPMESDRTPVASSQSFDHLPPPPTVVPQRATAVFESLGAPCLAEECEVLALDDGSVLYVEQGPDGSRFRPADDPFDRWWWCFEFHSLPSRKPRVVGRCFNLEMHCEAERRRVPARQQTWTSCREQKKAACTFWTDVMRDTRRGTCWSSLAACEDFLAFVADQEGMQTGDRADPSACEVLVPGQWR